MDSQDVVLNVRGRDVNISAALPFRIGDWRRARAAGFDVIKMPKQADSGELSIDHLAVLVDTALQKADPALGAGAVDDLTITQLNRAAQAILQAEKPGGGAGIDRPTSSDSSSSPSNGAGDPPTSNA